MRLGHDSALPFRGGKLRERWERLLRRERLTRERLEVLAEAGKVLSSSLDYEITLRHVIELALPMLGAFGFFDVTESPDEVRRIALAPEDARRQEVLERSSWSAAPLALQGLATRGEPLLCERVDGPLVRHLGLSPAEAALLTELNVASLLVLPLHYNQRLLGSLTVFFGAEGDRQHGPEDLSIGNELAQRAAAALENARLFRQAQEASRKRDEFLSVASHELKTPLTTLELQVSGLLRALRLGRLSPEEGEQVIDRLDRVERQVQRLNLVIEELLDATQLGGERLRLRRHELEMAPLVEQVVQSMDALTQRAGTEVHLSLDPVRVQADRARLEQVVANLFSNALKYGAGKPVEIVLTRTAEGVRLQVSDHGIGIAPEDQDRIFERFERAVSPRKYSGMGMGLWTVKQIVEAHGGTVGVISVPGVGSSFTVDLPL